MKREWLNYMQQHEARAKAMTTTAVTVTKCFMSGDMVESLRGLAMKKTGELEIQAQRCKFRDVWTVLMAPEHHESAK